MRFVAVAIALIIVYLGAFIFVRAAHGDAAANSVPVTAFDDAGADGALWRLFYPLLWLDSSMTGRPTIIWFERFGGLHVIDTRRAIPLEDGRSTD